jgi:plasmid maintenance system antidote protein VapI
MGPATAVGRQLAEENAARGWSVTAVAQGFGVARGHLSAMLNRPPSRPRATTAVACRADCGHPHPEPRHRLTSKRTCPDGGD